MLCSMPFVGVDIVFEHCISFGFIATRLAKSKRLQQVATYQQQHQVTAPRLLTTAGFSVVVCAPTGAGKTAIAEAAAVAVLARGQRVIYTTPLKALSNQKLHEMRARFGVERVGLQTGDGSLNIGAVCLQHPDRNLRKSGVAHAAQMIKRCLLLGCLPP